MSVYDQHIFEIPIVWEDAHTLVVDKPSGMLVHPAGKPGQANLQDYFNTANDPGEPIRVTHRLDRPTSGLVLLAKSLPATQYYGRLFTSQRIKKTYLAEVIGHFPECLEGTCELGLTDDTESAVPIKRRTTASGGESAVTRIRRIKVGASNSLLQLSPHTGRRHQLRVHLSSLGYPIKNDPLYHLGDAYYLNLIHTTLITPPMHLHAHQLTFTPFKWDKEQQITSPLPDYFG